MSVADSWVANGVRFGAGNESLPFLDQLKGVIVDIGGVAGTLGERDSAGADSHEGSEDERGKHFCGFEGFEGFVQRSWYILNEGRKGLIMDLWLLVIF